MAREGRDLVLELVAAGEVVAVGDASEAVERVGRAAGGLVLGAVSSSRSVDHLAEAREERAEHVAVGRISCDCR